MSSAQWHADQALGEKVQREWEAETRFLRANSDRLAKYIMENVPGEPSESEGAVDCAMRIMHNQAAALDIVGRERDQLRRDLQEIAAGLGVGCADGEEAKRRIIAFKPRDDEAQPLTDFPNAARRAVLSVLIERGRQDTKWGADRSLDLCLWLTILGEEYGEVCKAVLEKAGANGGLNNVREELVHVAAVAVAAVEDVDRRLK